jgi:hypothetical protein
VNLSDAEASNFQEVFACDLRSRDIAGGELKCPEAEALKFYASVMPTLPIIDIGPYLSQNPVDPAARKATSEALHAACTQFGFFYLSIAAFVDPAVPEELATLARKFFALPQAEKDKLSLSNQDNARGLRGGRRFICSAMLIAINQ